MTSMTHVARAVGITPAVVAGTPITKTIHTAALP
jgi:hypothetical protein